MVQAPSYLNRPASERSKYPKDNAYLDPTDRPLSPGEMFALFILGLTFIGCLMLVFTVGLTKGELVLYTPDPPPTPHRINRPRNSGSPRHPGTDGPRPNPDDRSDRAPLAPDRVISEDNLSILLRKICVLYGHAQCGYPAL